MMIEIKLWKLQKNIQVLIYENRYYFLLVFSVFLVLHPALFLGFSEKAGDDNWMVYDNPFVKSLDIENVIDYFTSFYVGQYSPINTFYYSVVHHFFGLNPFWYHAFSLAFHVINSILVFTFIRKLVRLQEQGLISSTSGNHEIVALATALLFAIHPVQVESVVWIAASKVVFYAMLFLLALICYLKFVETSKKGFYVIALTFFVLSFGVKEQTVILPLCMLAIDYYLGRDILEKKTLLEKIPFFLVAIGLGVLEIIAQDTAFSYKLANDYYPLWQRLCFASFSLIEYVFKLAAPLNLSYRYPFPMDSGAILPLKFYFYPIAVLVVACYMFHLAKAGKRSVVFGVTFFVINLILTLHIIPMSRNVMMADRYLYISCIGLFYVVTLGLAKLFQRPLSRGRRYGYTGLVGMYVLVIAQYAYRYALNWN